MLASCRTLPLRGVLFIVLLFSFPWQLRVFLARKRAAATGLAFCLLLSCSLSCGPLQLLPRCLLSIYRRPTSAVQCGPVVPCISCEADASGCSLGTPQSDVLEPVHVFPPHCCSDVSAGHSNTRDCDLNHRLSFKCCYSVDS